MLKDAKLLEDKGLVWSLVSAVEAMKGVVGTVNERKRNWERRERVSLNTEHSTVERYMRGEENGKDALSLIERLGP